MKRGERASSSLFRRSYSEAEIFSGTVNARLKPRDVRGETKRGNKASRVERDGDTCTAVSLSNVIDLFVTDVSRIEVAEITRRTSSQFSLENQNVPGMVRRRDVYVIPLRYHLTDPPHYRTSGAVTYHR